MHCRRYSSPTRQRGAALILALLVFAVCAALIVAMKSDFQRVYQRGGNIFVAEQARAYLRGAEGLATLALLADWDADKQTGKQARDTLDDVWARDEVPYPLDDGGWLSGRLEDLQGRFNLNHLAERAGQGEGDSSPDDSLPTAAQAQFIRLLLAVTDEQLAEYEALAITHAIGDWLDADSLSRSGGAEDNHYGGLTPAYRAANRAMSSVSELRAVSGVSPELFQALAPWVTVWPLQPGPLNIHTAPAMVLRSLGADDSLRPLSAADALSLVRYRCETGFADVADLLDHAVLADSAERMTGMGGLLGVESAYFLLRARVEVAGREQRLYSVLERKDRQVRVLSRRIDGIMSPPAIERAETCET